MDRAPPASPAGPVPARHRLDGVPVCIDGRMLGKDTSGVSNYAMLLDRALRGSGLEALVLDDGGIAQRRPDWRKRLAALRPGSRAVALREGRLFARDIFREAQVHFNAYRRFLTLEAPFAGGLMHWTYPVPMRIRGWRNLYTVHDAIPLLQPTLTPISPTRHRRLLDGVIRHADRIVTVSEQARHDITTATGCPQDRIINLSQAIDVSSQVDAAPLPHGLEAGGYMIAVGTIEPRKNTARILEAHGRSGAALPLVIVGAPAPGGEPAAERAAARGDVILLPPQPRPALLALIRGARALLFPSLAEGFGLPIAEAMALGVPVLTSRGGATEETAGSAALLVDPLDVHAVAAAILSLAKDDALCDQLRAAGRANAARFGIEDYAERLLALYREVIHG